MINPLPALRPYFPPLSWLGISIAAVFVGMGFGWHASGDAVVADLCAFATACSALRLIQAIDHPDTPERPWRVIAPAFSMVISVAALPGWLADIAATAHYQGLPTITDPLDALIEIGRFCVSNQGWGTIAALIIAWAALKLTWSGNVSRFLKTLTVILGISLLLGLAHA